MSVNNGKFFDVAATQQLFEDIKDEFDSYSKFSKIQMNVLMTFSKTSCWKGLDAEIAKKLMGNYEKALLQDILDVHSTVETLEEELLEKFKLEVDNAPDAHIDYDTLSGINSDFQQKYTAYNDLAVRTMAQVRNLQANYGKYVGISTPSFEEGRSCFIELCGGDDAKAGYINLCMDKLVAFDENALALIQAKDIPTKVDAISKQLRYMYTKSNRIIRNIGNLHNRYGYILSDIVSRPGWNQFEEGMVNAFVDDVRKGHNGIINFFNHMTDRNYTIPERARDFFHASKMTSEQIMSWYDNLKSHDVKYVAKKAAIDGMGAAAEYWEDHSSVFGFWKQSCKDNEAVQYALTKLDFVYGKDGTYHVDVHAFKVDEIENGISGALKYITGDDYSSRVHDATQAVTGALGIDDSFCWQQFGGYMDLYDDVFDVATDMEKKKFVVNADGQDYTFWFWKGDYLNLGYGGECGFYEGNGNVDPIVKCATDNELKMSMYVDYNGDNTYDYAPSYNGDETWWITNFNPNGESYLDKGQEFEASGMTIKYDIDLTDHPELYEAFKKKESVMTQKEKDDLDFVNGHVIYTFEGDGDK